MSDSSERSSLSSQSSHYKESFEEMFELGHGGFGIVVQCKHRIDDQIYAVKKIRLGNPEKDERIFREVKVMAKLHHEHLVRYFHSWLESEICGMVSSSLEGTESAEDEIDTESSENAIDREIISGRGCLYIQMERCFSSLAKLMETPVERERAVVIFHQLVQAVIYLHSRGVIHRDIAPGNIFLGENNEVKLGDFGLARSIGLDAEVVSSSDYGLALYKAPEIEKGGSIGFMVDIFSLGIVFFELLEGFTTHRERFEILGNLKKGIFPNHWEEPSMAAYMGCISKMIKGNPSERPTIEEVNQMVPLDLSTVSGSVWEAQSLCYKMLGEVCSRVASSIPIDIWKSIIEVVRKEMDVLASMNLLVEENTMAKFYAALLQCLHLVLVDRKCSLSDHVPGFVAALQLFLNYGLTSCRPQFAYKTVREKKMEVKYVSTKTISREPVKDDHKPYRPPHLRRNDSANLRGKNPDTCGLSDHGSDSDYSDSDGSKRDNVSLCRSKVRVAALLCLQDLCQADPKAFTTQWTMLLTTNDVLDSRNFDATLMTCLMFDPYLKARLASASTLAVMLDGPSSVSLQVAEYKDSSKRGSYTSLSSSLGQILVQLHKGVMHLIMRESHSGLLAILLKILVLLISSTPYARMPDDLLHNVIINLQTKVKEGFPSSSDHTSLLAAAISCLAGALSVSPSSLKVQEMLIQEIEGFNEKEKSEGVLSTLFRLCEKPTSLTISIEALQALRALSRNYPKVVVGFWERVFAILNGYVEITSSEVPSSPRRGSGANTGGLNVEKVLVAAIKVLDECLRALSGFKGTEDLMDDKLLEIPFSSDCIRAKKVSSAPYFGDEFPVDDKDDVGNSPSGDTQWEQAVDKLLRQTLRHSSPLGRAASVTCFAGITSPALFSVKKQYQDFILSSTISAASEDAVPSVRSAGCRAIGVITYFPEICQSAETLGKFIKAVLTNTRSSIVSVRITASWALANICESIHHSFNDVHPEQYVDTNGQLVALIECALRLTSEGDKIKANAVRALGALSRYVRCGDMSNCHEKPVANSIQGSATSGSWVNKKSPEICTSTNVGGSHWLERIVQAFLSCVTTGNVKVQWNVCHALSNLFRNETLSLKDEDWAPSVFSILLLLLRDSSNFKIRIQAASALAVPKLAFDYGRSFGDVVKGVLHVLENLDSYQVSTPSGFKYRAALEQQLTITVLHVLNLSSGSDSQTLKDFLLKKASFLEEWLKGLCSSVKDASSPESESVNVGNQKKEVISKALQSLTIVFGSRNNHATGQKFEVLYQGIKQ